MEILKGKPVSEAVEGEIRAGLIPLYEQNIAPTLAIVRVGNNPGDIAYENGAIKKAKSVGVQAEKFTCPEDMEEEDVISVIQSLNENAGIHGILLLQPLPAKFDGDRIRNAISPEKDVDCTSDASLARFFVRGEGFCPCTAESAMEILKHYGVEISGRRAVVIGRSMVIGRPAALMLMRENATVTVCHSKTPADTLRQACREADIIVTAAGKIDAVTEDMMTEKQVIVDVGINFDSEGKMRGDTDFEAAGRICRAATPVPGGVGSVTTAILMRHLVAAAEQQFRRGETSGKDFLHPIQEDRSNEDLLLFKMLHM